LRPYLPEPYNLWHGKIAWIPLIRTEKQWDSGGFGMESEMKPPPSRIAENLPQLDK
jgi:hypothetical protein